MNKQPPCIYQNAHPAEHGVAIIEYALVTGAVFSMLLVAAFAINETILNRAARSVGTIRNMVPMTSRIKALANASMVPIDERDGGTVMAEATPYRTAIGKQYSLK